MLPHKLSAGSYWIGTQVNQDESAGYVQLEPIIDVGEGPVTFGGQGFSIPPGAPLEKLYDFKSFRWMPGMRPGS